jgi:pimeloyl-ACP methyl ester carboxylesterase
MEKLFQTYVGNEPYVFVCYAHEDSEIVYPEMVWLREQGINIWYDEGISAGKNWRAAIGDSLLGASYFLFYISEHSLRSDHCNREINLALDEGKHIVPIYLEDIELTSDLKVGLNRVQALHRDQGPGYEQHLLDSLGQSMLISGEGTGVASEGSETSSATSSSFWRKPVMLAVAFVLLAAILAPGYYYRDRLLFTLAINLPALYFGDAIEQELGFTTTADGIRIAYATSGEGSPIIQVMGSSTHLENGQSSPIYDNNGLVAMTSREHMFVRYDGRGFGLSDRDVDDFSLQARLSDLEAVVDALGLERFGLFAVSGGGPVGIAFTAEHPEQVTHLVLAGTMASYDWMNDERRLGFEQFINLIEVDWQRPYVSDAFAGLLLAPDGDEVDRLILGEMLRRSGSGHTMAAILRAQLQLDSSERVKRISVPTLVVHARDDQAVPLDAARDLAALIPGSHLEIIEGGHMASSGSSPEVRRRILDFFEE